VSGALGLVLGGVLHTLSAFPLVRASASHFSLMRWLVSVVINYVAVSMLRGASIIAPTPSTLTVGRS